MAYSPDFYKIACFYENNYRPGFVFEGFISRYFFCEKEGFFAIDFRIPKEGKSEQLIPTLKTLFCMTKDNLTELEDVDKIMEVINSLVG